ncbi:MAG: LysR substrate-binding domain-containing protein [Croceibacterium sp.]
MDRFESMRIFVKVVEANGFTPASASLGISTSMVSQHVKQLEERLGARLLNRTTRRTSLTEVGRAYYDRCKRLLLDLEDAESAVGKMQVVPRGDLRVNATPVFGAIHLAPAIADLTARFPLISVELMLSDRIVDLVDEGFDVAVRVEPLPGSSLMTRQIASCRLVICGAPAYFKKHGVPQTPSDLANHNCLMFTGASYMRGWGLGSPKAESLEGPLKGNLRSNNAAVLLLGALSGQGLVGMPTYLVSDALRSGRLRTVLDDYAAPPLTIRAVYPHNRHLSAKVRTFVDFLAERFGRETQWDGYPKIRGGTTAAGARRKHRGKADAPHLM